MEAWREREEEREINTQLHFYSLGSLVVFTLFQLKLKPKTMVRKWSVLWFYFWTKWTQRTQTKEGNERSTKDEPKSVR